MNIVDDNIKYHQDVLPSQDVTVKCHGPRKFISSRNFYNYSPTLQEDRSYQRFLCKCYSQCSSNIAICNVALEKVSDNIEMAYSKEIIFLFNVSIQL